MVRRKIHKKTEKNTEKSFSFIVVFLLLIIVLAGFAFRFSHMNEKSLWLDEGITYYNSSGEHLSDTWDKAAILDQSPPGYYFIMHVYLDIFGQNEVGFRLISVIFGTLTILFLYLLMAAMFNAEVGLISAFLLAINAFHIGFSIEARMYSLLCLEAICGFYLLYKAINTEGRFRYLYWLFFTLISICGLYTHNFFAFALAAYGLIFLILLLNSKNKLENFGLAIFSIILILNVYSPWIPYAIRQLQVNRYWIAQNSMFDIPNYLMDFVSRNPYFFWGALFFMIAGIIGVIISVHSKNYRKYILSLWSLIAFFIIGMGIPLIYSLNFEAILKIRYVIYLVPIMMALISLGLYLIRRISLIIAITLYLFIFFAAAPWDISQYPIEMNEDYRNLVEQIDGNTAPVVVHTPSVVHVIDFYSKDRLDVIPFPDSFDLKEYNIDLTYRRLYQKTIENFNSFYLILSHSHEEPYGLLEVWSQNKCAGKTKLPAKSMALPEMQFFYFYNCSTAAKDSSTTEDKRLSLPSKQ